MKRPSRNVEIFSMSALDLFASAMGAFIVVTIVLFPYYLNTSRQTDDVDAIKASLAACQTNSDQQAAEIERLKRQIGEQDTRLREQAQARKQARDQARDDRANLAQLRAERDALAGADDAGEKRIKALERRLAGLERENRQLKSQAQSASADTASSQTVRDQLQRCEELMKQTFLIITMQWPTQRHDIDLHVVDPTGNEFFFKKPNLNGRDFPGSPAALSLDNIRGPGVEMWQHPVATPGPYRVYYKFFDPRGNPAPTMVKGNLFYRNGRIELRPTLMSFKNQKVLVATIVLAPDGKVDVLQ